MMIGATVEFNWYDPINKRYNSLQQYIDLGNFKGQTIDQLRWFIHNDFYQKVGLHHCDMFYRLKSKLIELF